MKQTYKIASTAVIHELLDNEVIVANLDSGVYYSLRGTAVPVWQLLLSGKSLTEISHLFAEKYQLPDGEVIPGIQILLDKLLEENLLSPTTEKVILEHQDTTTIVWPGKFSAPSFEKYEEMRELLMLDPIHEVDEQGWPSAAN